MRTVSHRGISSLAGKAKKLMNTFNWIQPYTHVSKVSPYVLTLF